MLNAPEARTDFREVCGPESWRVEMEALGRTAGRVAVPGRTARRRILIPMLVGASDLFAIREGLIAHALRLRGAEPIFVLCDGFPVCDARTYDNDPPGFCERCYPKGAANLQSLGLSSIALSSLVGIDRARELWQVAECMPADELFECHHGGIPLGRHVYASTLRYFRAGTFDPSDASFVARARQDLAAAMVMTEAAREAYRRLRPDKIFANHPYYACWGPWTEMARAIGIAWDTYHGGWRKNTLMAHHESPRTFHCDELWERYRSVPLDAAEESRLDDYLASRETNAGDFHRFFERVDPDVGQLCARLGLEGRRFSRKLCAFTNVSWDAADYDRRGAFDSMFDWVRELIDHFRQRPDVLLLIKAHPAERQFVEATPERWQIARRAVEDGGRLPDNVRFIASDDNVSNFALYSWIDAGLVNTSTVGLEMALAGMPVLTTGAGVHYEKPGLVLRPGDKREYFELLERAVEGRLDFRPDRALCRRYAYTLFFRKALPFEPLDVGGWEPRGLRIDDLAELGPGRFRGLDALCRGILDDTPFAMG